MKTLMITLLALAITSVSCDDSNDIILTESGAIISQINAQPKEPLSASEKAALLFMREEEKLARDVYDNLYVAWSAPSFNNISESEQSHMDAILALINKYELVDPAAGIASGKFVNTDLQALYDDLIMQGLISRADGFKVGAAIEEIDIVDLQRELATNIDNNDITLVFENLMKGSRNHLRSFVKNLATLGITYSPKYLTQEAFDAIINTEMERGGN
jgi:hypothetical protein